MKNTMMAMLVVGMVLVASVAHGVTIRVAWHPYENVGNAATSLKIYNMDNVKVWEGPLDATQADFEAPNECGAWYITGANPEQESANSNIVMWCPKLIAPRDLDIELITN